VEAEAEGEGLREGAWGELGHDVGEDGQGEKLNAPGIAIWRGKAEGKWGLESGEVWALRAARRAWGLQPARLPREFGVKRLTEPRERGREERGVEGWVEGWEERGATVERTDS